MEKYSAAVIKTWIGKIAISRYIKSNKQDAKQYLMFFLNKEAINIHIKDKMRSEVTWWRVGGDFSLGPVKKKDSLRWLMRKEWGYSS